MSYRVRFRSGFQVAICIMGFQCNKMQRYLSQHGSQRIAGIEVELETLPTKVWSEITNRLHHLKGITDAACVIISVVFGNVCSGSAKSSASHLAVHGKSQIRVGEGRVK